MLLGPMMRGRTSKDPYGEYRKLLLHCEGANGATSFVDSSRSKRTVNANGNLQISTSSPKFGTSCALFDGTGDYLGMSASADFGFSGDFTVDMWVKTSDYSVDGSTYRRVIHFGGGAIASTLMLLFYNGSAESPNLSVFSNAMLITGSISVADGSWHHVALTRSGTSLKLWVDGVQSGSTATTSQNFNAGTSNSVLIGIDTSLSGGFNGTLDEIAITNGVAIWNAAFTPPTGPTV